MFEVIPAIDLKGGQAVRLVQGDFDQATVFGDDPPAVARRWVEAGAGRLHVVDLDGSKAGAPAQLEVVRAIVQAVEIPVQLGGGIRDRAAIEYWLALGIDRVVLGTAAYVVGIGLIGLALGLLLRSTAGAISALLAGVLVLPTLAGALLPDAWDGLLKYLPSNAASAFTSTLPTDSLLSAGTGALVFTAWIVVALAGAAVALTRRDA